MRANFEPEIHGCQMFMLVTLSFPAEFLFRECDAAEPVLQLLGSPESGEIDVTLAVPEPPPHLQKRVEGPRISHVITHYKTFERQSARKPVSSNQNCFQIGLSLVVKNVR